MIHPNEKLIRNTCDAMVRGYGIKISALLGANSECRFRGTVPLSVGIDRENSAAASQGTCVRSILSATTVYNFFEEMMKYFFEVRSKIRAQFSLHP